MQRKIRRMSNSLNNLNNTQHSSQTKKPTSSLYHENGTIKLN